MATDLLDEADNIAKISTINFGLMVRKKTAQKKIKERFGAGFTFPQQFQHCWPEVGRVQRDNSGTVMKRLVLEECFRKLTRCSVVGNHDKRLVVYLSLMTVLQEKVFGVGELCAKHLISIMSVLGILPSWLSTTSSLGATSKNYQTLVQANGIWQTKSNAVSYLRTLGFAL